MTEQEWLRKTNPMPMLRFLRCKVSDRKLRLFACACVRDSFTHLPTKWIKKTLRVAERHAEGLEDVFALHEAEHQARAAMPSFSLPSEQVALAGAIGVVMAEATKAAKVACDWAGKLRLLSFYQQADYLAFRNTSKTKIQAEWNAEAVSLLRCIIGNPFRPVTLDHAWMTDTAKRLANTIYADRAFDRLPILADALEEAGCTETELLDHCRQPGEHVLGCWVADLLLGKA